MKVNNQLLKKFMLISLSIFLLSSCGDQVKAIGKAGKVLMNPDIPVGDNSEQESIVRLYVRSAKNINPDLSGEPSPVRLQIYQLKSDHLFMNTDYYSLNSDPKEALGTTYINHEEYEILPDAWVPMKEIKLNSKTEAIGVLAFFNDIDNSEWRTAKNVKSQGEDYDYLIQLNRKAVHIIDKDNSKARDDKAIRQAHKEDIKKAHEALKKMEINEKSGLQVSYQLAHQNF